MTQVSRDDVVHLAVLSRLQLTDEEIDGLQADITKILGYVDLLNELDTTDVEPTYQVGVDLKNVWRGDEVVDSSVSREQLLALAPATADNQIKVPKVL
jgi:aspartyl-tRNA(Asn)/glutamyl-tRNA(Gln) amidotransferase subunit C